MIRCSPIGRTVAAGALALAAALASVAAAGQPSSASHITAARIDRVGDVTVVTIEADGPLPEPAAGTAQGPPRIFFDFPGLLPKTRGAAVNGDPSVRRIRAAVHSSEPRVTRVVLDLFAETPFEIDRSGLSAGRLSVRIGSRAAARPDVPPPPSAQPAKPAPPPVSSQDATPLAPVPPLPPATQTRPAAEPPRSSPASPPAPVAPPRPAERPASVEPPPPIATSGTPSARRTGDKYRQQLGEILDKARLLRPVLSGIDRSTTQKPDVLEQAAVEFTEFRRALAGIKPPDALRPTYDMLVRACTLGTMASRLRADAERTGDAAALRNAASAAAGALLLIDRACVELGCT